MKPTDIPPSADSVLENVCGFALGAEPSGLAMLPLTPQLTVVAGDGMGGVFFEWNEQALNGESPIVYLSSYGESSRFADNLADAVRIVLLHPSTWHDALVGAHKSRSLFERIVNSGEDLEADERKSVEDVVKQLGLSLVDIDNRFYASVQRQPPFQPLLNTDDGITPSETFASRPYPK